MMYCKDCVELLADYIEGALPPDMKEKLEDHLSYCPPCVAFVRTYKATSRAARKHLATDLPADVGARLHEFLSASIPGHGSGPKD